MEPFTPDQFQEILLRAHKAHHYYRYLEPRPPKASEKDYIDYWIAKAAWELRFETLKGK